LSQHTRNPHWFAILILAAGMGAPSLQAQPPGPALAWSSYAGGDHFDGPTAVAVDSAGHSYIVGSTSSSDFALPNPLPVHLGSDVFVLKVSPTGELLWSTRLGHRRQDYGFGIAVDAAGHVWITGRSEDFPQVHPLMPPTGSEDAFVARLDREGGLLFSTHLGGLRLDYGTDIALDAEGNVYVTGVTESDDFPVVNPLPRSDPYFGRSTFVTKLSPGGERILYSTRLGGNYRDEAAAIAVDAQGHAYVGGTTFSWNFPTVAALQAEHPSRWRAGFVSKLHPSGSSLVYSTYVGGSSSDDVLDLTVDASGEAFITGMTSSSDFPILHAVQPVKSGHLDAYLMRLSPEGDLLSSTYFGGSSTDEATGIALDPVTGVVTLAGITRSRDLPLRDPLQDACLQPLEGMTYCMDDVFVAQWSRDGSALLFSSYLGGWDGDGAEDAAAVPGIGVVVTGTTVSLDFPTKDPFQSKIGQLMDSFVLMLQQNRPPDCSAAAAIPAALWPPNGRLVPVAILGVTDPDGDPVTLRVTAIRQDEPLTKTGTPDASGLGTSRPMLRADRAGNGDGRVYHLTFEATDLAGAACSGTVTVCVPHDQGKTACGDGGPLADSTGGR
jgi:hypothetical protein